MHLYIVYERSSYSHIKKEKPKSQEMMIMMTNVVGCPRKFTFKFALLSPLFLLGYVCDILFGKYTTANSHTTVSAYLYTVTHTFDYKKIR